LPSQWKFQASFGDLTTRKNANYFYSNAIFGATSATYTLRGVDLSNATPSFKFELDVIPPYSSTSRSPSITNPNVRVATELYTVSTVTIPLRKETKAAFSFRVGLTPYTPKFVAAVQLQHLFRVLPCVGCLSKPPNKNLIKEGVN
jgi:hypothetical protein